MLASSTTNIAIILVVLFTIAFLIYAAFNVRAGRDEIGSEIELAANRKKYYDDETLEGPRLERVQLMGVALLGVIAVALPFYWILEPNRQAGAQEQKQHSFEHWGESLFAATADGGFNCAGCHGGMNGTGGSAPFTITDPVTGEVKAVNWKAPALNTALYRFSEEEIRFILVYGRPFSPMSPWGLEGGGPMNTQQIDTLISYMESIQVPREDCLEGEEDITLCSGGHLPTQTQEEIETLARKAVDNGEADSYGEALFNLELGSGAYSCARCHTQGWSYDDPGQPGIGAFGWNLTGGAVNKHFADKQDMIDFIKAGSENGKTFGAQGQGSGRMPGFGSLLTDEQIEAIVDYVRTL